MERKKRKKAPFRLSLCFFVTICAEAVTKRHFFSFILSFRLEHFFLPIRQTNGLYLIMLWTE